MCRAKLICAGCGYRIERGDQYLRIPGEDKYEFIHPDCLEGMDGFEVLELLGIEYDEFEER